MKEELLHIKKELSKKLKKERFEHTVGVMYTSASLAMRYGANIEKAMTAGLLHLRLRKILFRKRAVKIV